MKTDKHHVVVVGGGFAGVSAIENLSKDKGIEITLIDRTNHHLMQPLLYQVATGSLSAGSIAPALRSIFRKHKNVTVRLAEVNDFDLDKKIVKTSRGDISYDTLLVAAGATHSYFGNEQWAEHAPGLKTLGDAAKIRTKILAAFELSEHEEDEKVREQLLTFVIVGAGPTGVELAGQIAELANNILKKDFRNYDPASAKIIVLDASPHVLGPFDDKLRTAAQKSLEKLGVEVKTSSMVTNIDNDGVTFKHNGEEIHIESKTVLWAAGVAASPLARKLAESAGQEITDRAGRINVNGDLTLLKYRDVYALGDMVLIENVPGVAQPAIQEGKYVASIIRKRLKSKSAKSETSTSPFKYHDKGSMATIGRGHAVAQVGKLKFKGSLAWWLWGIVHLRALIGTGNKVETLLRWGWSALTNNRRERIISTKQVKEL